MTTHCETVKVWSMTFAWHSNIFAEISVHETMTVKDISLTPLKHLKRMVTQQYLRKISLQISWLKSGTLFLEVMLQCSCLLLLAVSQLDLCLTKISSVVSIELYVHWVDEVGVPLRNFYIFFFLNQKRNAIDTSICFQWLFTIIRYMSINPS